MIKRNGEIQTRIADLESKEKLLATEFEKFQEELFLIEEFIRAKVSMLTDAINSKFKMARFKLFDVQINGGINECCEATYNGVPYASLNHGAQVNVGLDIINTIAEYAGFAPFIFIDNCESLTSVIETRGQQIRLIVSKADPVLRVETFEGQAVKQFSDTAIQAKDDKRIEIQREIENALFTEDDEF